MVIIIDWPGDIRSMTDDKNVTWALGIPTNWCDTDGVGRVNDQKMRDRILGGYKYLVLNLQSVLQAGVEK